MGVRGGPFSQDGRNTEDMDSAGKRVHIISQAGLIGERGVARHPLDPFTQRSSIPNSIWCLYYRRALTEQPISAYDHRNVRLTGETRSLITTVGSSLLLRSRLCGSRSSASLMYLVHAALLSALRRRTICFPPRFLNTRLNARVGFMAFMGEERSPRD